jgi:hypothetical protein
MFALACFENMFVANNECCLRASKAISNNGFLIPSWARQVVQLRPAAISDVLSRSLKRASFEVTWPSVGQQSSVRS